VVRERVQLGVHMQGDYGMEIIPTDSKAFVAMLDGLALLARAEVSRATGGGIFSFPGLPAPSVDKTLPGYMRASILEGLMIEES
jgi:hypothetical protein